MCARGSGGGFGQTNRTIARDVNEKVMNGTDNLHPMKSAEILD
jgi:hypothetical protein